MATKAPNSLEASTPTLSPSAQTAPEHLQELSGKVAALTKTYFTLCEQQSNLSSDQDEEALLLAVMQLSTAEVQLSEALNSHVSNDDLSRIQRVSQLNNKNGAKVAKNLKLETTYQAHTQLQLLRSPKLPPTLTCAIRSFNNSASLATKAGGDTSTPTKAQTATRPQKGAEAEGVSTRQPNSTVPLALPIGIDNTGSNCWINSLFQMIYANNAVKEWLGGPECPQELKTFQIFIGMYDKAARRGKARVGLDSQMLRLCLANLPGSRIGHNRGSQEDPTEAWMLINERLPERLKLNAQETLHFGVLKNAPPLKQNSSTKILEDYPLALDIGEETNPTLNSLMAAHCNSGMVSDHLDLTTNTGAQHRYSEVAISTSIKLTAAPPSLPIYFKRFNTNGDKSTTPINMPERYQLELQNGKKVTYQLNSFLVHLGINKNGGHYLSFRRNEDGEWYMMNDARVEKVEEADLAHYLGQVYFAQYSRT